MRLTRCCFLATTALAMVTGLAAAQAPLPSAPSNITVTTSVTGFTPNGNYAALTATGSSSASTALPNGATNKISNTGATAVSCTLASGAATGTRNNLVIQSGSSASVVVGTNANIACIDQGGADSTSNVVVIAGGAGLGNDSGGGGGGGGSNAAAGSTGSAVPGSASYNGVNIAGNLRGQTGVNPSGVVFAAQTDLTSVNGTTALAGTGAAGAGSPRVAVGTDTSTIAGSAPGTAGSASANVVTVQGVASMTKLLVTPDSVALPANQSVNVSQINGVTPLMGNGVTGTGSQRVTIASDNTAFSVNAAATLNAETTKVIGTVRNLGNAGAIIDFAGQNAASPANSWLMGGQFNTAPTTITNGNASPLQLDNAGNLLVNVKAGGAGGGAVTIASGAVASGAYASGSIASGAFASGSISSGANVTEGTTSPTITCATTWTINGCLAQIDADIKGPISPATTSTGAVTGVTCGSAVSSCVLKNASGNLYGVYAECSAACWLMVFNSTSAPSNGSTTAGVAANNLVECLSIPAHDQRSLNYPVFPANYSTGITAAISSTECATLTLATTGFVRGTVQ